jgi:hypothetical protein
MSNDDRWVGVIAPEFLRDRLEPPAREKLEFEKTWLKPEVRYDEPISPGETGVKLDLFRNGVLTSEGRYVWELGRDS